MQFIKTVFAAALVATVAAHGNDTIVWVTETKTDLVTYCPAQGTITYPGGSTYTNTATVGVTITVPCPGGCVHSYPVTTTTGPKSTAVPPPVYPNVTVPAGTAPPKYTTTAVGTTSAASKPATTSFAAGAGRVAAGSAAGLAGLLGMAAYIL